MSKCKQKTLTPAETNALGSLVEREAGRIDHWKEAPERIPVPSSMSELMF